MYFQICSSFSFCADSVKSSRGDEISSACFLCTLGSSEFGFWKVMYKRLGSRLIPVLYCYDLNDNEYIITVIHNLYFVSLDNVLLFRN